MTSFERMIKSLPEYERRNALINAILRALSIELEGLNDLSQQNYDELFIDTATRALEIYERDLGISGNGLNLRQRREAITANYRASLQQSTEEAIRNIISTYSNGNIEINETSTPGVFEIKFVGNIGVPDNLDGIKNTMQNILPAHLEIFYTFVYNTWGDISVKKWGELASYTWLQAYEEEIN